MPSQREHGTAVSSVTPRMGRSIPFTAPQQGTSARASSCLRQQKMEDREISPISLGLLENPRTFQRHSWLSQLHYRPSPASQFQQGVLTASNTTQLLTGTQPSFLPSQIKDADPPSRVLKSYSRQTLTFTQLAPMTKTGSVSHENPPSPRRGVHKALREPPGRLCLTFSTPTSTPGG